MKYLTCAIISAAAAFATAIHPAASLTEITPFAIGMLCGMIIFFLIGVGE